MQFETLTKKQLQFIRLLYKRTERYRHGLFVIEGARAVKQALLNNVLTVFALVGTKRSLDLMEMDPEFFSLVKTRMPEGEAPFAKTGKDEAAFAKTGKGEAAFAKTGKDDAKYAKTEKDDAGFARPETANGVLPMEVLSVYRVTSASFRLISDTEATQEILLVCSLPEPASESDLLGGSGLVLASDRIQDPGNMGSIIRTAVWFGVKGLVVSPDNVDLFHPKLVRSNVGSTAVLPWVKSELPVFLDMASQKGWNVLLLDSGDGSESYKKVKPSGKDIIVVGNEANGISKEIMDLRFPKLRIDSGLPVAHVESLNVSVAAAIMLSRFS